MSVTLGVLRRLRRLRNAGYRNLRIHMTSEAAEEMQGEIARLMRAVWIHEGQRGP